MIRRTLTSAVAAVGVGALLPLGASAAKPTPPLPFAMPKAGAAVAGTCTLTAPSRVAIWQPHIALQLKAAGPCTTYPGGGAWELIHPSRGHQLYAVFDGVPTTTWDVRSTAAIGQQTWRPVVAADPAGNPLTQNSPVSGVRLAAAAWISSSRTADVVTLKGTSLLYSPNLNKFFKRSAGGVFQFREIGQTNWQTLKSVWTNSAGEVTLAYRYSKTRDYRFAVYSTSVSWDLASAITRR
jgi:hypothetical protein